MPGWHEALRELTAPAAGEARLQTIGIVQEQHPDRARLFMQWKQMDWPVMADPLNQLGVDAVPITLLIDEHGVVRHRVRRPDVAFVRAFVETEYPLPDAMPGPMEPRRWDALALEPAADAPASAWDAAGCAQLHANAPGHPDVDAFERAVAIAPDEGAYRFRLGVALRHRYDARAPGAPGASGDAGDFQAAIDAWQRALDLDPNQYIWRRRIQQYGPRLIKPYPFYDWVPVARAAIEARGETPVVLPVEPSGAEYAQPARSFESIGASSGPDADGRITRDTALIGVSSTVVPGIVAAGEAVRAHVRFEPRPGAHGHWNNEAEPMQVRLVVPEAFAVDVASRFVPNAVTATSVEPRVVEFEIRTPGRLAPGEYGVHGYALVNVCEGVDGVCLYRRVDFDIVVRVGP